MATESTKKSETEQNSKKRQLEKMKPIFIDSITKAFPQNKEVTNNLPAIFDLLGGLTPFTPDDETRKLGFDFLYEAVRDTKSCKLLYSKKIYSHAIYHLQQAVEKSVKGHVLLEGYYKATELKEFLTHDTPLIMLKAVLIRTGIKGLAENSTDLTLLEKINNAEKAIKDEDERIKIAKMGQGEIKTLLSQREEYQGKLEIISQAINNGLTNIGLSPMPISFLHTVLATVIIMILAIITFPHESYTRYPEGKMNPNNYNKQLGIVLETPKMVRLLEAEIQKLVSIYQEKN